MKIDTALLVGLGGTGSLLVEAFARLLMYHPNGTWKILLADLDVYEPHNAARQLFRPEDLDKNKAIATVERLSGMPNLIALPGTLDHQAMHQLLTTYHPDPRKLFLVVMAVDNHGTRKAVLEVLDQRLPNYVFVNPGNAVDRTQCSVHIKLNDRPLTPHPLQLYADMANPTPEEFIPGTCGHVQVSAPQSIAANFLSAATALLYVSNVLDDKPVYQVAYGNTERLKLVTNGEPFALV